MNETIIYLSIGVLIAVVYGLRHLINRDLVITLINIVLIIEFFLIFISVFIIGLPQLNG